MTRHNGDVLRDLRLGKRMTQQQLADALGLSQSHLARVEAGERDVTRATQIRLAQFVEASESLSFFERLKEIERMFPIK